MVSEPTTLQEERVQQALWVRGLGNNRGMRILRTNGQSGKGRIFPDISYFII